MKHTTLISGSGSELAFKTILELSKKNNLVCITSNKEKFSKKLKNFKPIIIEDKNENIEDIASILEKKKLRLIQLFILMVFMVLTQFKIFQKVNLKIFLMLIVILF